MSKLTKFTIAITVFNVILASLVLIDPFQKEYQTGDFNKNGVVNFEDMSGFQHAWNEQLIYRKYND